MAMFAPGCRYTDVPYRMSWEGHDGIRKLFKVDTEFHPDKNRDYWNPKDIPRLAEWKYQPRPPRHETVLRDSEVG